MRRIPGDQAENPVTGLSLRQLVVPGLSDARLAPATSRYGVQVSVIFVRFAGLRRLGGDAA